MARSDFRPGANPALNGPHVLAVLAGEEAEALAAAIVPVISTADSSDSVVAALTAESDYAEVDFVVAQFVGPMMVASLRGSRLTLRVDRTDGVEATLRCGRPGVLVDIRESDCALVEIHDAQSPPDQAPALPLPLGWQAASTVVYQSEAMLTAKERREWHASSTASDRFDPPPMRGLEFSDGRRIIVDRTVLIGRSPQVDESAGGEQPAVVAVDSPERDISRTHLRITTDSGRVLLEDLNSTNGTEVTPRDGDAFLLEPGTPALLEDGMVVSLGEHVAFKVVTVG